MILVEIHSFDAALAIRISDAVSERLNDMTKSKISKSVSYDTTLLGQGIKLIKVSREIDTHINTLLFLESARESELVEQELQEANNKDKIVFKAGSYLINMSILLGRENVKRVLTKYLIRKFAPRPAMIFFIRPDQKAFAKRRKERVTGRSVEDSLKGKALEKRDKRIPVIFEKLNKQFGIKHCIIECEDNPAIIEPLVQEVIKQLTLNGVLQTND